MPYVYDTIHSSQQCHKLDPIVFPSHRRWHLVSQRLNNLPTIIQLAHSGAKMKSLVFRNFGSKITSFVARELQEWVTSVFISQFSHLENTKTSVPFVSLREARVCDRVILQITLQYLWFTDDSQLCSHVTSIVVYKTSSKHYSYCTYKDTGNICIKPVQNLVMRRK